MARGIVGFAVAAAFVLRAAAISYDFGSTHAHNNAGGFRGLTYPPLPYAPLSRIATVSCIGQNDAQPGWNSILSYQPEALIFAGDNVYGDVDREFYGEPDEKLVELEASYFNMSKQIGFMTARAATPLVLSTWDDHDFGDNDGGRYWPYKDTAQAMFNNFWDTPLHDERRSRGGVYTSHIQPAEFGTVQFIVLDTRYFRDNLTEVEEGGFESNFGPYIPAKDRSLTLLGDEQWEWLEEQLKEQADVRIIVSSIQVIPTAHGWEKWGNLPHERKKLFDLIRETKAGGVVFVSGDRHSGMLYELSKEDAKKDGIDLPYPMYELTGSGLSKYYAGNMEPGPLRLGAPVGVPNWGSIDIDWLGRKLKLCVRDIPGRCVREADVRMHRIHAGGPVVSEA